MEDVNLSFDRKGNLGGLSSWLYVEYNPMSKGRRKVGAYKPVSSRYYPPNAMPLVLCGACPMVVLASSQKAKGIYDHIVGRYRLPDMQQAFKELGRELSPLELVAMWEDNVEDLKGKHSEGKGAPLLERQLAD